MMRIFLQWTHSGQTVESASTGKAHQKSLGLILPMMPQDQMQDPLAGTIVCKRLVASRASSRLYIGGRFLPAPFQDRALNSQCGQAARHEKSLVGGLVAQAVIERYAKSPSSQRGGPFVSKNSRRHGVGAARDGNGDLRFSLERAEPFHKIRELSATERIRR